MLSVPIHYACDRPASFEVILCLVQKDKATLQISNIDGAVPLHLLCRSSCASVRVFEFLVEQYPDSILARDGSGNLPIHTACHWSASSQVIRFLAEKDNTTLHISNKDYTEALPIHLACRFGTSISFIECLVEQHSGSINACDGLGNLPIHIACSHYADFVVIRYLAEKDLATLHISNNAGNLPIHLACRFGRSLRLIKFLVEENGGAGTLCARGHDGNLPLHALCGSFDISLKMVKYVIQAYPAATSTRNSKQRTSAAAYLV